MDEIDYRDEGIILFQAEKKAKDLNCVKYLECSALSKSGFVIFQINIQLFLLWQSLLWQPLLGIIVGQSFFFCILVSHSF